MTRTFDGPGSQARPPQTASRPTPAERAIVLGGFAVAALCTAVSAAAGTGMEAAAAIWLAAVAWAVLSSLALALRRGLRDGDWSAFRRHRLSDGRDDRMDWVSKTGRYAHLRDWEDRIVGDDRHLR